MLRNQLIFLKIDMKISLLKTFAVVSAKVAYS